MSYLVPIKAALIIFPFLALLITLPYIIYEYHHYGSVNKLRTLIIYSFILYLITILLFSNITSSNQRRSNQNESD